MEKSIRYLVRIIELICMNQESIQSALDIIERNSTGLWDLIAINVIREVLEEE